LIHETFRRVKFLIGELGFYRKAPRQSHSDGAILAVFFWAALNNKPVYWAIDRRNWSPGMWRGALPSQSCVSRRLACDRLSDAIERIAQCTLRQDDTCWVAFIDGKPTEIALHSQDADAGTGRGVGHVARGYKLHAVMSAAGTLLTWRIKPLNIDERAVAAEMIEDLSGVCYLVADCLYHAEHLFIACARRDIQLVAPRKKSEQGKGTRRKIHRARKRSIAMLERGDTRFGESLVNARTAIERYFAQLSNAFGTIAHLPIWVRSLRRVTQWINARIALAHISGSIPGSPICVAA
jgi:hypothetical protein